MTDEYFMKKALVQAENAFSAGEFPVGCVIADKKNILAIGFRHGTSGQHSNEIDHAEIVALRALYEKTAVENMNELTLYCTMEPCLMCLGAILISGIPRIVYAYEDVMGGGTRCDLSKAAPLYSECDVSIVPHVLRQQSLALFKAFFSQPENDYWKNSLLAEYTLAQKI
ncbi:MAG: nucleoside deaminase [Desulfobacteraceae bacterium]|nr:nucleoside deaminase [Desulfobacteraceae bacterium]MBC2755581.1 nucleoside deaminase [Desulfobacteraceae bacterium]